MAFKLSLVKMPRAQAWLAAVNSAMCGFYRFPQTACANTTSASAEKFVCAQRHDRIKSILCVYISAQQEAVRHKHVSYLGIQGLGFFLGCWLC